MPNATSALAYISNLLLRTLPEIERETYGHPDAAPVIILEGPRPIRDDPTKPS